MQDVESPERGKNNPSANGLLMAQVILQPELFEAEFRAGIPSSGLPEPRPTGFAGDVSLQFQLQQTLEFQLTVELQPVADARESGGTRLDRKSTRLNSSHVKISYAVFC